MQAGEPTSLALQVNRKEEKKTPQCLKKRHKTKTLLTLIIKLGNGDAAVREFLLLIPLAFPRPGRVEEGINNFSQHLTTHFQSMLITLKRVFRIKCKTPETSWLPDGYSQIFRLYVFGPSGFWTMATLSLDCARVEGVGAQSKERKGSNYAA